MRAACGWACIAHERIECERVGPTVGRACERLGACRRAAERGAPCVGRGKEVQQEPHVGRGKQVARAGKWLSVASRAWAGVKRSSSNLTWAGVNRRHVHFSRNPTWPQRQAS